MPFHDHNIILLIVESFEVCVYVRAHMHARVSEGLLLFTVKMQILQGDHILSS